MADHHATRLSNIPFAKFESRIESVTEEEVIAEWLEKMKTQTTYVLKPEFGEPRTFEDGGFSHHQFQVPGYQRLLHGQVSGLSPSVQKH